MPYDVRGRCAHTFAAQLQVVKHGHVPTFAELGLAGFEDAPYYGFFAPAGTPKAEIDRFSAALQRVIVIPEVRDKLTTWGLAVGFMPQQQLAARERAYAQAWARIIKESGFQPQ